METIDASFADASAEWLRYVEHERDVKPSTLSDYRHMAAKLNREFGELPLDSITAADIERWKAGLGCSNRTAHKYLLALNGIFKRAMRVYGLPGNPMALVERPRIRHSHEIDVFSPAEVRALLRATPDEALRAAVHDRRLHGPAYGRAARAALARRGFRRRDDPRGTELHDRRREQPQVREVALGPDGATRWQRRSRGSGSGSASSATRTWSSPASPGGHLCSRYLRGEYKAALARAGLRSLRFHDLRHTFGTRAVEQAESILELKEWMGHANVQTTMRYLHYKSKADAARRLALAFVDEAGAGAVAEETSNRA